ncbi:helix-turn-helix domain-containing protein [Actinomadura sp.]|uniref:helix-turn-helix domain-containing protein n=1 Tax=Actinomadura sp. TaxID=1989 RepID=UPI0037C98E5B
MSALITVDDVPVADRTEFFRQMTASTWVPMECRPIGRWDGYRGKFRTSGLGPMQVVVMDIMPITVHRTPSMISMADPDLLKLFLVCGGGRCGVGQGGRQALLSPAEFAFYDTRRPYEVVCGLDDRPTRVMTFMFPPSLLPLPPGRVRGLTAMRIPATSGLGDLTSQFLLRLARNVDHLSPAEAARVSSAALEVLATRLAGELDVRDWDTPQARRHALLTTIQGFIRQHLGDPGLTPASIAAAHHISVRTLHQLFHDEGLTVAGWIRRRRLERCRGDLADPALAARPVAAIAARWGFSSAADFSRAFRAEHGLPPSEYRRSARNAKDPAR